MRKSNRVMGGEEKRLCSKCKSWYPLSYFSPDKKNADKLRSNCKSCVNKASKSYHENNPGVKLRYSLRHPGREKYLKFAHNLKKFGLTPPEYESLLKRQNGVCDICKRPPNGTRLAVDHDHETGQVRGLLHKGCNLGIGNLNHNPEWLRSAATYLERK